jgi:uncharacterized DUF497 family protein
MRFEWDEATRAANLAKHGLDFIDAKPLLDGRPCITFLSPRGSEVRFVTVGLLGTAFVALVWTERNGVTRLISFRRARDGEKRQYRSRFGSRSPGHA